MKIVRIAALTLISAVLAACGIQAQATEVSAPRPGHAFNLKTDDVIVRDQRQVRANPNNWRASDELAGAYLQKVREVGDPSYYPKVEALLHAALQHDAADIEATTLMGTLSLARHQFTAALSWGREGPCPRAFLLPAARHHQ